MRRSGRKTRARWRFALATSVVFTLALGTNTSSATKPLPVAVRISESLPADCPKKPTLRERLEVHLGDIRAPEEGEPAIEVALRIRKRDALNVGTLRLTAAGVSVQREASSTSCEDVVAALTIMAAIAIDEQAGNVSPEPVSPPPPNREPSSPSAPAWPRTQPTSARSVLHRPPPSDGAPSKKRLAVAFGSGVEVNGNRGAVLAGTWFAQVTFPAALDPTIRLGFARSVREQASIPRGAIAIRWVELTWAACADVYRDRAFRVGPCLNGELGSLEATVIRPLPARDIPSLWLSFGAAAKMSWQLVPPFSIDVIVGARAPILRRELFFEPFERPLAYHAPAVAPFAEVGFVVRLP